MASSGQGSARTVQRYSNALSWATPLVPLPCNWPVTDNSFSTRSAMRPATALRCPTCPARLATRRPCTATGMTMAMKASAASTSASVKPRAFRARVFSPSPPAEGGEGWGEEGCLACRCSGVSALGCPSPPPFLTGRGSAFRAPNTGAKPARMCLAAGIGRLAGLNLIVQTIGAEPDLHRILLALAKLDGVRARVADKTIWRKANHWQGAACTRQHRAPVCCPRARHGGRRGNFDLHILIQFKLHRFVVFRQVAGGGLQAVSLLRRVDPKHHRHAFRHGPALAKVRQRNKSPRLRVEVSSEIGRANL